MNKKLTITNYIRGQQYYSLPIDLIPKIDIEIYNGHNKKWRKAKYQIVLQINEKEKKTDETIKIYF